MKYSTRTKPMTRPETLALLKVLALGTQQIERGRVVPARKFVKLFRGRIAHGK